ncbi:penicillin-binding protein 1A [Sutterella sp.]|uniref:penicillin-binding protein 1A n=1 Tax=Sutterella sp. TaxID=1981025 RepID=UPI0026E08FA8|nr:PBP1A family penicillin-binding protein [Sutterella sp.]MDO5531273.1 PBP1A family penicillin-binding protein [Sutterella sp.]
MTTSKKKPARAGGRSSSRPGTFVRVLKWVVAIGAAGVASAALLGVFVFAYMYQQLPPIDALTDYRPKVPLRVWSADGKLIGEFGEERRDFVKIEDVPDHVKKAILAAEDDGFYEHPGIEITGIARAAITNLLTGRRGQGGSTITMQVARNFFLTTQRTYTRKLYEIAMSFKIEHELSKDRILEIYMNQIYLGQRAYGFASAARTYFGRPLEEISVGEAATIAGLPVAPSAYNPIVNPSRATMRRNYVLRRMYDLGHIDELTYQTERAQPMQVRRAVEEKNTPVNRSATADTVTANYAAELARMLMYDIFGDETYSRGLNVHTTLRMDRQLAAVESVRRQLITYDRRYGYRGPEAQVELGSESDRPKAIREALSKTASSPFMLPAVVIEASPTKIVAAVSPSETVELDKESLKFGRKNLAKKPAKDVKPILPGSVIRVMHPLTGKDAATTWTLAQVPQVETAFAAANFNTGAVEALVGGFDFNLNMFNHVTQAWRQPGSSFKPFIYSAALDKGFTPSTIINDAPIVIDPKLTGNKVWEPKNYEGRYDGPMPLYRALELSKNLVSIRILQSITPAYAQQYIQRFGFQAKDHPANLPMALGAGSVTPWQMLGGYMVFANGGYRVQPYLIDRVTDSKGVTLMQATNRQAGDPSIRAITERNAFVMNSLMHRVAVNGTARRATRELKRNDISGKTGTSNDSQDAWFCGYAGTTVAVGWMGYDQPKPLGSRETGGGLVLPIWIDYMRIALKDVPETARVQPESVVERNGLYYYKESAGSIADDLSLMPDARAARDLVRDQIF